MIKLSGGVQPDQIAACMIMLLSPNGLKLEIILSLAAGWSYCSPAECNDGVVKI